MSGKIARSISLLLALNILVKPFWLLVIERSVQNALGNAAYGHYFVIYSITFYLQIILDPGLHTFNQKSLVKAPGRLPHLWNFLLPVKALLSGIYGIATYFLARSLGESGADLIIILIINQIATSLLLYFRSCISGMKHYYLDSVFSVVDRILMSAICAFLLYTTVGRAHLGILSFAMAQAGAVSLSALAAGIVVWKMRRSTGSAVINEAGDKTSKRETLFFILCGSYPYAILGILMSLYTRIDAVMINALSNGNGAADAGVYAAGFRLLDAAVMFPYLVSNILLPAFTDQLHQRKLQGGMVKTAAILLTGTAILVALAGYFYSTEIAKMLKMNNDPREATVFGFLILSFPALSLNYVYGTLLTAAGRTRALNSISLISLLANVILNFRLVPEWGPLGAVVATVATQSIAALANMGYAIRVLPLSFDLRAPAKLLAMSLFGVILFKLFERADLYWLVEVAGVTLLCVIFALSVKLIRPAKLFSLFKQGNE